MAPETFNADTERAGLNAIVLSHGFEGLSSLRSSR
jgi:hypothetical protein